MFASRPSFSRRAFTIIELLVVIAIISILMSLLLPMLGRIRRQGQIVASPIAYIGEDQGVRLTSGTGRGEVDLRVRSRLQCPVCHTPPTWSPSGTLIALRSFEHKPDPALPPSKQDQGYTTIIDPMANTYVHIPEDRDKFTKNFVTWVDSERVVIADRGAYFIKNRRNGATMGWMNVSNWTSNQFLFASPTPPGSTAHFVGVTANRNSGQQTIMFFRKDLTPSRRIHSVGGLGSAGGGGLAFPRIDPMGEYVAWSQFKGKASGSVMPDVKNTWQIALKDVRSPSNAKATIIGSKYISAAFCDFTEGGDILANVTRDVTMRNWKLALFDRNGGLIREIDTPTPPAPGTVASWRKFGRR